MNDNKKSNRKLIKLVASVFSVCAFLLVIFAFNYSGDTSLFPKDDIDYYTDWNDVGITLHEDTEELLEPIDLDYDQDYEDNLVNSNIFDRFVNVGKAIAQFGREFEWKIDWFSGNGTWGEILNWIATFVVIPVKIGLNFIELIVQCVNAFLGFPYINIRQKNASFGSGFFGGR